MPKILVVDVQFKTSQLRQYRDQAREMALQAAQEKARDLAGTAGTQVACVLNIEEINSSYTFPWQNGRGYQWMTQNAVQNAPSSDPPPSDDGPIGLGQISVQAEVQVRFSLK